MISTSNGFHMRQYLQGLGFWQYPLNLISLCWKIQPIRLAFSKLKELYFLVIFAEVLRMHVIVLLGVLEVWEYNDCSRDKLWKTFF